MTDTTLTAEIAGIIAEARMQCAHPNVHFHYTDGARVMGALADAVERMARSSTSSGDVGVKELVWRLRGQRSTVWEASPAVGDTYTVKARDNGQFVMFADTAFLDGAMFTTEAEAQAAAQADFETRIRSALTTPALAPQPSSASVGGVSEDSDDDFPDRIWAGDFDDQGFGHAVAGMQGGLYVEYVRADLASSPPPKAATTAKVGDEGAGRWEAGFRSIVTIVLGARQEFEIKDIIERVRALTAAQLSPVSAPREAQVEAAAEVIWNDFFGARAGAWDNPPKDQISAIQTRATARAALLASLTIVSEG